MEFGSGIWSAAAGRFAFFSGEVFEVESEVGLSSVWSAVQELMALFLRLSLARMFSPETDHAGGPGVGLVPMMWGQLLLLPKSSLDIPSFFGLGQVPTEPASLS